MQLKFRIHNANKIITSDDHINTLHITKEFTLKKEEQEIKQNHNSFANIQSSVLQLENGQKTHDDPVLNHKACIGDGKHGETNEENLEVDANRLCQREKH